MKINEWQSFYTINAKGYLEGKHCNDAVQRRLKTEGGNKVQNNELTFQKEVAQKIKEFKQTRIGKSKPLAFLSSDPINSTYRYTQVVNDLVYAVLCNFKVMAEDAEDNDYYEYSNVIEEVVGEYSNYWQLHLIKNAADIYNYSPFNEYQLEFCLKDFDRINQAVHYLAVRSLEKSVRDNEYILHILKLVEKRG